MEIAKCNKCDYAIEAYTLGGIITKVLNRGGSLKYDRCPSCKRRNSFKLKLEG